VSLCVIFIAPCAFRSSTLYLCLAQGHACMGNTHFSASLRFLYVIDFLPSKLDVCVHRLSRVVRANWSVCAAIIFTVYNAPLLHGNVLIALEFK
jgi:hypothetical protein